MNRHPHPPLPTRQRELGAEAELEELLQLVYDTPGPSAEQVTALDQALEPFLGAFASAAPTDSPTLEGSQPPPHSEQVAGGGATVEGSAGPGASPSGLLSGKLLGVVGTAVVVGAVLLGTAQPDTLPAASEQLRTANPTSQRGRTADTSSAPALGPKGADPARTLGAGTTAAGAPGSPVGAATGTRPPEAAARSAAMPGGLVRASPTKASTSAHPRQPNASDWSVELQRLERAEEALKEGRIEAALSQLDERRFRTLQLNARALRAAVLCKGSPGQRKRGASLARKMAANDASTLLVRRLRSCMDGD